MAAVGDTLTLPGGTSFLIVESASRSGGERVEFEITMVPGAIGPPRHYHPAQEEHWRVLGGELSVFVEDAWRVLAEGDSLTIPPATVHTLRNRSAEPVRFRDVHVPALDFQDYIEALARLTATGKMGARVTPSSLIHGAMVLRAHRTTQLSATRVQRAGETLLSLLGKALGYRIR